MDDARKKQETANPAPEDDTGIHGGEEESIAALQEKVKQLRRALGEEEARCQELLSSTSWRITAPIRLLKTGGWRGLLRKPSAAMTKAKGKAGLEAPKGDKERVPKPRIPAMLRADHVLAPEESNDTYRLIDAHDALEPLLKPATPAPAPLARPRIFFLGSSELAEDLAFDAEVVRATEVDWKSDLRAGRFDYLLLETVWHVDNRNWRYSLVRDSGNQEALLELFSGCREMSLPIVLWFRESPANYGNFAWLGEHADRIYGVDDAICSELERDHPGKPVGLLPVAVQPALHNPTRSNALRKARSSFSRSVLYDGWWDLGTDPANARLLEGLRDEKLLVCESEWDFSGVRLMDRAPFAGSVVGCVDGFGKAALNKVVPVELFLGRNLRLPWRERQAMIRAAACGTLVLRRADGDDPPLGVAIESGKDEELAQWVRQLRRDSLQCATRTHALRRSILESHCVRDRLSKISSDLGLAVAGEEEHPGVAMVLVTMRPQLLGSCIERFRAEKYPNKELVVVMHGDFDRRAAEALVAPGERIRFLGAGRERSLGACLNRAIVESDSPYWSKVDDDDLYGPHYLYDLMLARRTMDYKVAGKPPMFAYLESEDTLYWDSVWADHAHLLHAGGEARAALIAGGTITGRREVIDEVPFSEKRRGGSDSEFIRRCFDRGHDVLASDGFNFVRYRSSDAGFHTWNMDEKKLKDRARAVGARADVGKVAYV